MVKAKYCYWSVCDGAYGALMEHCVRTARTSGVFKEFHVLTDRPIDGCESYDCYEFDKSGGLFKLHYLKTGMTRLNFDYFIWLDADSSFTRNPIDVLAPLGRSPIHVPLEVNLTSLVGSKGVPRNEERNAPGVVDVDLANLAMLESLLKQNGVRNPVYLGGSAFWIVHHDVIELVYELGLAFWHQAKAAGLTLDVSQSLAYAMQMLCADPEAHRLQMYPHLWGSRSTMGEDEKLREWKPTTDLQGKPTITHTGKGCAALS